MWRANSSRAQAQAQGADFVLAAPAPDSAAGQRSSVFALLDGHGGSAVSRELAQQCLPQLAARLPPPPADEAIVDLASPALHAYAEALRRALAAAFLSLHLSTAGKAGGHSCGASMVVVVQTGPLLTVANVGTSRAVLDVGKTCLEVTTDCKLGCNEDEEERLDAAGATVARLRFDLRGPATGDETGCGPLRLWPGGITTSRALGDSDCRFVLPHPHITQVWLPPRASRLIVATSSVWDAFSASVHALPKAASALRDVSLPHAAAALLQRSLQRRRQQLSQRGDMSVLVVEVVPDSSAASEFRGQLRLDRLSQASTASNGSGVAPAALLRRLASAPGALPKAPNLSVAGMQSPGGATLSRSASAASIASSCEGSHAQQQQQQQQQQQSQSQAARQQGSSSKQASDAACKAQPLPGPNKAGTSQLQRAAWRVHRFLGRPFHRAADGSRGMLACLCGAPGPQHGAAGGFSQASAGGASSGNGAAVPRRLGRQRAGGPTWPRQPPQAQQQQPRTQVREDGGVMRVYARVDTFYSLCHGRYDDVELQLALLDSGLQPPPAQQQPQQQPQQELPPPQQPGVPAQLAVPTGAVPGGEIQPGSPTAGASPAPAATAGMWRPPPPALSCGGSSLASLARPGSDEAAGLASPLSLCV